MFNQRLQGHDSVGVTENYTFLHARYYLEGFETYEITPEQAKNLDETGENVPQGRGVASIGGRYREQSKSKERTDAMSTRDGVSASIDRLFEQIAKLPTEEQKGLLGTVHAKAAQQQKSLGPPPLPDPGDKYPRYPGRVDAFEWLKNSHWADWLTKCNHELDRDYLFQDQLRKRDPKLVKALENQGRTRGLKLADFVPPLSVRIDAELENLGREGLKKAARLEKTARMRSYRQPS